MFKQLCSAEIEKSAQMGSADAGAEADTNVVMKSRWLMDDDDDDEDLPTANGQVCGRQLYFASIRTGGRAHERAVVLFSFCCASM